MRRGCHDKCHNFRIRQHGHRRELEAMGFLQIKLAASEQVGWTGGFGVVR
jgi:hypothetical protein